MFNWFNKKEKILDISMIEYNPKTDILLWKLPMNVAPERVEHFRDVLYSSMKNKSQIVTTMDVRIVIIKRQVMLSPSTKMGRRKTPTTQASTHTQKHV